MDWQLLAQAVSLLGFIAYNGLLVIAMLPVFVVRNYFLTPAQGDEQSAVFLEGAVTHLRQKPKKNFFRYPVRTALVNLDKPPKWFAKQSKDHMTSDEARAYTATTGSVWLLTNPISAGYTINPISVYYCYDSEDKLSKCIAEVTNTPWNERVTFVFLPESNDRIKKSLHVSPLMDMKGTWHLHATDPRDHLRLVVKVSHPDHGDFFYADLVAKPCTGMHATARNEEAGLSILYRYGFQPHRIAIWIYWQAVVLLWRGLPLYSPPPVTTLQQAVVGATHPVNAVSMCPFTWRAADGWPWDTWAGRLPGTKTA